MKDKPTKVLTKSPVILELPVVCMNAYINRHLDVQMSRTQALALRRVLDGLRDKHAVLTGGKHVDSTPDALRWILDSVYEQLYGDLHPGLVKPAQW